MFGFYYGIIILIENPKRKKYLRKAIKYGMYSTAFLFFGTVILSTWKINIEHTVYVLIQFTLGVTIIAGILIFIYPDEEYYKSIKVIIFGAIILYATAHFIETKGKIEAHSDMNIEHSTLSVIKLKFDGRESLRILKVKGDLFYFVDLDTTNNNH